MERVKTMRKYRVVMRKTYTQYIMVFGKGGGGVYGQCGRHRNGRTNVEKKTRAHRGNDTQNVQSMQIFRRSGKHLGAICYTHEINLCGKRFNGTLDGILYNILRARHNIHTNNS